MLQFQVLPGGRLQGRLRVPGDKSISHRAVMLGALAEGTTEVNGLLEGEDVLATIAAFRHMGIPVQGPTRGQLVIHGKGAGGLTAPQQTLDMGNSGTAMRLLAGILCGQSFDSTLAGDESLSRRPMHRIIEPLTQMGAAIASEPDGRPPLRIHGGRHLKGIDYRLPVASAQVKSAILLAALYANGTTRVTEPAPTRDHTERMLNGFGYEVIRQGPTAAISGGGRLRATSIDVPADISSAAFFLVGASIATGSELTLEHVGINPTRTGVLTILRLMGADITIQNERIIGGEPVADLQVKSASLRGIEIPAETVPLAIDEFPVLFIAAACADGVTRLSGAKELRVKESDRIAVMAAGLKNLGIDARETEDGLIIRGGALTGGQIDSHGDHRIAMAFAVAGMVAGDTVTINDCRNVNTSFPGFVTQAAQAGLRIHEAQI